MANIGETTKLLFEALSDLNHQDIPVQQRFKTLELLRKPVHFVNERMKKHFVGHPLPLDPKNLKIAHLSREMSHALATGYKVLVMEQIAGIGRKDKKLLITAIHRAIKLLTSVLLKAYQVYEPYPDCVWLEIHSLYRYAEDNRLHNSKVSDDYRLERNPSSIADTYKQILLLALACPYRLRHGEVEGIYLALEDWAAFCTLQPIDESSSALFATNFDSDQPPSYLMLRDANENRNTCRVLNTQRLADRIRKELTERRESGSTPNSAIGTNTLRRLMLAWGVMPKRRFSRTSEHAQIVVAMGLSAINYFVSGEVAFNDAAIAPDCVSDLVNKQDNGVHFQEPAQFQARTISSLADQAPDIWEMTYRVKEDSKAAGPEDSVVIAAQGMQIDASYHTQNWKMVNVSAGGYCLLWDNPETTRAQVGELLGIREEGDPDTFHWRLAVIRWLKFADKHGLELGVQMLSPGAVAIAARMDKTRSKKEDYTRGLLLPEVASIQQRATLLLPSPPFKVGDTAIANCHGKDVRVKLSKLVENTGSFAQFQFVSLGEVDLPKARKRSKKPRSRDFDDIWDLL
jgi:hypothetical protein